VADHDKKIPVEKEVHKQTEKPEETATTEAEQHIPEETKKPHVVATQHAPEQKPVVMKRLTKEEIEKIEMDKFRKACKENVDFQPIKLPIFVQVRVLTLADFQGQLRVGGASLAFEEPHGRRDAKQQPAEGQSQGDKAVQQGLDKGADRGEYHHDPEERRAHRREHAQKDQHLQTAAVRDPGDPRTHPRQQHQADGAEPLQQGHPGPHHQLGLQHRFVQAKRQQIQHHSQKHHFLAETECYRGGAGQAPWRSLAEIG